MSRLPALFRRLPPTDPRPDGQLLAAFRADRDEAAFAELVRRHGPVVWAVCRRHLPDPADAEDAFQAAFLVLVRRAGRLTASAAVGPWLYRVAAWTARNLRRKNARQLARRKPLPADVPVPLPLPLPDLDSALLALPEKYRTPLVLCHLQGWTRRAAAEHLGCPEGTLSSLLSRGLAKLRTRLAGRDPATVLAVAAAGAVPADLAAATVRTAAAFQLAAASPALVDLSEGVLRMFWVKKAAASGVAAVMLLTTGIGVGLGVRQTPAAVAADENIKPSGQKTGVAAEGAYDKPIADLKRLMVGMKVDLAEHEQRAAQALALVQASIDRLEKEAPLIPLLRKAEAANDRKEVDRLRQAIEVIRAAEAAKRPPVTDVQLKKIKALIDEAAGAAAAEQPPGKADKPDPAKDADRQREREAALLAERDRLQQLQLEAKLLEEIGKELQAEQDRIRDRKADTELHRRELLARIARLKGETGKADALRDFELVIGGPRADHRYTFIERADGGHTVLLSHSPGEQGLRRHLARVAADPKGPKTVHISVAHDAPAARLQAAMDAIKAAGFSGTTKRTLRAEVGTADELGDTLVRAAVKEFLKALAAKDADALLKVADVPFWWDEARITTARADLSEQLRKAFDGQGFTNERHKATVIAPLAAFEEAIKKKLPEDRRKKLEGVLGKDHRMVLIEVHKDGHKGEGILAVRIKDGTARVVGIVKY